MMRQLALVGAITLCFTSSAYPATQVPVGPIVDTCSPPQESAEIDKACATAVDDYILAYDTAPDKAAALGDLAFNLASLTLEEVPLCNPISREVGKIGDATPDAEQAAALQEISL